MARRDKEIRRRVVTGAELDAAFPTFIRYLGAALTLACFTASVLGVPPTSLAAGYVASAGMILYKTVKGAATPDADE